MVLARDATTARTTVEGYLGISKPRWSRHCGPHSSEAARARTAARACRILDKARSTA
jgi:hypothetical protein